MPRYEDSDRDECDVAHVVTPEMARKGTELHAEAHRAFERGMTLQGLIDALERQKEVAWDEQRSKRSEAERLLMGPRSY